MRTARLFVILTLLSCGAAFAQSTVPNKTTQHHQKPNPAKPDPKANKDADKAAKKTDKEAAKKSDTAQNRVYSEAYKTKVPKP